MKPSTGQSIPHNTQTNVYLDKVPDSLSSLIQKKNHNLFLYEVALQMAKQDNHCIAMYGVAPVYTIFSYPFRSFDEHHISV